MKLKYISHIAVFIAGYLFFWLTHDLLPGFFHRDSEQESTSTPWQPKSIETDLPRGEEGAQIKFGYLLVTKTSEYIGPLAQDSNKVYAGNPLACSNCHLNAGRKIGSGSFVGVANRFPQFRGRENKQGTLAERINGCMERSMNGQMMPEDSKEMKAMIAYMKWLSKDVPEDAEKLYKGYVKIKIPEHKANPELGKQLYKKHCINCHLEKGEGTIIPGETFTGYIYPPLSGKDSYNDGAGMNRVITAAEFLKANMPFGATYDNPILTDEEAFHIAAYINTFDRSEKPNKHKDFPDRKLKPVSTPYGPWADDFSPEQHKFGPFPPMIEFYKDKYNITKTK